MVSSNRDFGRDDNTLAANVLLGNGSSQARVEGGLFYTGRQNLDLGAVITYQLSHSDDRRYFGNIRLGYYF